MRLMRLKSDLLKSQKEVIDAYLMRQLLIDDIWKWDASKVNFFITNGSFLSLMFTVLPTASFVHLHNSYFKMATLVKMECLFKAAS